ncbi:transcription factor VBP-like [Maniola hyperantus]|uniref:transcription factor VBP-like n=1 Tax=Aphantopus hyperantus TaxID=2795564 RepID=UPI00156A4784|nr:transcription factor VBP-like [Maniola hyperantus]
MALWTPYAENTALDLTVKCKPERISPEHYPTQFQCYENHTVYQPHSVPYPYTVGYPVYVPTTEAPVSPVSSCTSYPKSISPQRNGMISPPESPVSINERKRPSYMMDVDSLSDDPDFQAFERDALRAMAEKNGGTLLGNNPRMRRAVQTSQAADDSYRKQRERNNFAAKQSRDRRKLREIHLALKVTYLKNEVAKLKGLLGSQTCVRCRQSCMC